MVVCMRLLSFDYFRGIAIILIVAGHTFGDWKIDTIGEALLANIVSGSTILFLFISGFFFHHVFYHHFDYSHFIVKKLKYVFVPYLILSTIGFGYYAWSVLPFPYAGQLPLVESSWLGYVQLYLSYIWTGRIMHGYWYIPFIMLIFLLSPLFVVYIKQSFRVRISLMLVLLALSSILIHRPYLNLSPLHAVAYFVPVYLVGINVSIDRLRFLAWLQGKTFVLSCVVISLAALQMLMVDYRGSPSSMTFLSFDDFDLNVLQKIALCCLLLSVLEKCQQYAIPFLKCLASSSFAIYFIHTWVLHFLDQLHLYHHVSFLPELLVWIVITAVVIGLSLLIAWAIKGLFSSSSRYVIGW
jgi:fucose 4-O-acetylase-like acetyltransferase